MVTCKTSVLREHIVAKRKITFSSFARQAGITRGYLSLLLNEKRSPSQKVAQRIVHATRTFDRKELRYTQLQYEDLFSPSPTTDRGAE